MATDSHIVIGPDGTVLAVTSDLPATFVDRRLEDLAGVPRACARLDRLSCGVCGTPANAS